MGGVVTSSELTFCWGVKWSVRTLVTKTSSRLFYSKISGAVDVGWKQFDSTVGSMLQLKSYRDINLTQHSSP